MLIAHTWHNIGIGYPLGWVNTGDRPSVAAAKAKAFLDAPGSSRVLFIWGFPGEHPFIGPLENLVLWGPNYREAWTWFRAFWEELARLGGVRPVRIVWDFEGGCSYWHRTREEMQAVLANPAVNHRLPAALRTGPLTQPLWDTYGLPLTAKMLYELSVALPRRLLGWSLKATNYSTVNASFEVWDCNKSILQRAGCLTTESSPCCYLTPGNFTRYHAPNDRHANWLELISQLNILRSARARGRVLPWLAWPSYSGDGNPVPAPPSIWQTFVAHAARLDITEVLGWWPAEKNIPASDLAIIRETLATTTAAKPSAADLLPLDFNAAAITTGNLTTTYADFLAASTAVLLPTGGSSEGA